jgi:hypothetical protein
VAGTRKTGYSPFISFFINSTNSRPLKQEAISLAQLEPTSLTVFDFLAYQGEILTL